MLLCHISRVNCAQYQYQTIKTRVMVVHNRESIYPCSKFSNVDLIFVTNSNIPKKYSLHPASCIKPLRLYRPERKACSHLTWFAIPSFQRIHAVIVNPKTPSNPKRPSSIMFPSKRYMLLMCLIQKNKSPSNIQNSSLYSFLLPPTKLETTCILLE